MKHDEAEPLLYDKDLLDTAKLSNIALTSANPKRFAWLRSRLRLYRIDWFIDRTLWSWVADKTRQYEEPPQFNWFFAGVHVFAWTKVCGLGWKFSVHCGLIHWGWVKTEVGPPPE